MRRLPFFPDGRPLLQIEPSPGRESLDPDPNCSRCSAAAGARTRCVPPVVAGAASGDVLLVLGDRTGNQEDVAGKPFVGVAGQQLRKLLEARWRGPIVYTNATACFPGPSKKISPANVRDCRPYVIKIIEDLRPARIIALGSGAARSVVDVALPNLSTRRAYAHTSYGAPVFFCIHPGETHTNSFLRKWCDADLLWALTADPPPAPWDGYAELVENAEDALRAVDVLEDACNLEGATLSLDLEWYGQIGDIDYRVLTVGASVGHHAYVWDEGVLGSLRDSEECEYLLSLVANPSVPKSAHNAKSDAHAFEFGFGVRMEGFSLCTRLHRKIDQADAIAYLEDMQSLVGMAGWKKAGEAAADTAVAAINTALGLVEVVYEHALEMLDFDLTNKKHAAIEKQIARAERSAAKAREGWVGSEVDLQNAVRRVRAHREPEAYMYGGVDPDVRALYCAMDTVSQQALVRLLEPRIAADKGFLRTWREVQRPFHRAIEAMEANGLRIDVAAAKRLQKKLGDRIVELRANLADVAGESFNPNTAAEVAKLFQGLGAPLGRSGKSGLPSTDKTVLKKLVVARDRAGRRPEYAFVAETLMEYRRYTKFKSTYADGILHRVTDDGLVHPNINIDGTESGRPSADNPNVLNFPRASDELGKMCRDMLIAHVGWWLLEVDQSQVEFRKAAVLSGDDVMIDMFHQGIDFHLATAKLIAPMFGLDSAQVDKDHWLRDAAKTIGFAVLYGDPVEGTAHKLNISVARATELRNAILGKFKRLARWIDEMLAFGRRNGYCVTYWLGEPALRRPLWAIVGADEEKRKTAERSSWNTPVQGTAALITNASCGVMQARLDGRCDPHRKLLLTVYDSILLGVREGHVRETVAELEEICTRWHPILKIDHKVGRTWGAMGKITNEIA